MAQGRRLTCATTPEGASLKVAPESLIVRVTCMGGGLSWRHTDGQRTGAAEDHRLEALDVNLHHVAANAP